MTVTSCKQKESQYKDAIVGKWQVTNGSGVVFEFRRTEQPF